MHRTPPQVSCPNLLLSKKPLPRSAVQCAEKSRDTLRPRLLAFLAVLFCSSASSPQYAYLSDTRLTYC